MAPAVITKLHNRVEDGERLLLIVGMQKSGTTLMMRALRGQSCFVDFAAGEGDAFWGNQPAHRPTGPMFGQVFQRRGDIQGHAVEKADMTPALLDETRMRVMREREKHGADVILFNKSPYNTVRLEALRLAFPAATIICMLRDPFANVFSLKKKHVLRDRTYDGGWWGVKPPGWRDILPLDETHRIAAQWEAVLGYVWKRRDLVDLFVPYDAFVAAPTAWLDRIARLVDPAGVPIEPVAPFPCFDREFETGASAVSRNRTIATSEIRVPPLSLHERHLIERQCGSLFRVILSESCRTADYDHRDCAQTA